MPRTDGAGIEEARRHFGRGDPNRSAICRRLQLPRAHRQQSDDVFGGGNLVGALARARVERGKKGSHTRRQRPTRAYLPRMVPSLAAANSKPRASISIIATRLIRTTPDRAMDRGTTLIYLGEPEAAIEVMNYGNSSQSVSSGFPTSPIWRRRISLPAATMT